MPRRLLITDDVRQTLVKIAGVGSLLGECGNSLGPRRPSVRPFPVCRYPAVVVDRFRLLPYINVVAVAGHLGNFLRSADWDSLVQSGGAEPSGNV